MTQSCRNCYSGAPIDWSQPSTCSDGVCRNKPPTMGEMKASPTDPTQSTIIMRFMPVNLNMFWCREWESRWWIVRIAQKLLGF